MKKYSTLVSTLVLGASLVFTGCGNSSDSDEMMEDTHEDALLFFYDSVDKTLYSYDTEHEEATDENNNSNNNADLSDKAAAQMIYWPHETPDGLVEKYMFLNEDYNIVDDGNLTHNDIIYIGHQDAEGEIHMHLPAEFDPNNPNFSDDVKAKKAAGLKAMNMYLIAQNEIKNEIETAIANEPAINSTLCDFFVPTHEEEEGEEHEETPHFAVTTDGKAHVFTEGDNGLEKHTINITLTGADECIVGESGIASAGEHGVYIYLNDSQRVHLVDEHGSNFHEHSKWLISDYLPTGISATQMIGVGATGHSH